MIEVLIKALTQEYVPKNEFVFWEKVLWWRFLVVFGVYAGDSTVKIAWSVLAEKVRICEYGEQSSSERLPSK